MTAASDTEGVYTVLDPMNEHGAVTVRDETNATYHAVDYAAPELRDRLADLSKGSTVRLELVRAGGRANVWKVTRVLPGNSRGASTSVGQVPSS